MWNIGVQTPNGEPWVLYERHLCACSTTNSNISWLFHILNLLHSYILYIFLCLFLPDCISPICSAQQLRNTQRSGTGQRHRGTCEEQDGDLWIIYNAHKYRGMWHNLYKINCSCCCCQRIASHELLVSCQRCDSYCQLSSLPTNGHCTVLKSCRKLAYWPFQSEGCMFSLGSVGFSLSHLDITHQRPFNVNTQLNCYLNVNSPASILTFFLLLL